MFWLIKKTRCNLDPTIEREKLTSGKPLVQNNEHLHLFFFLFLLLEVTHTLLKQDILFQFLHILRLGSKLRYEVRESEANQVCDIYVNFC